MWTLVNQSGRSSVSWCAWLGSLSNNSLCGNRLLYKNKFIKKERLFHYEQIFATNQFLPDRDRICQHLKQASCSTKVLPTNSNGMYQNYAKNIQLKKKKLLNLALVGKYWLFSVKFHYLRSVLKSLELSLFFSVTNNIHVNHILHPSVFLYPLNPIQGRGVGVYPSCHWGERQSTLWTDHQSIAGPYRRQTGPTIVHTHTHYQGQFRVSK